jgi:hypothetical protein
MSIPSQKSEKTTGLCREEAISVPGGTWTDLTQGLVVGWPRLQVRERATRDTVWTV